MAELLIIITMLLVVLSVILNQNQKSRDNIFGEGNILMMQIQEEIEEERQKLQNNLSKSLIEGKQRVKDEMIKEREITRSQLLANNCSPERLEQVMQMYNKYT